MASISISSSGRQRIAWIPVEAGTGSSFCSRKKCGAFLVECLVVALDVAQVAGGADDVVPGGAFGFEQAGDVLVGAAQLGAEVADVDAAPCSSMLAVPEIRRMARPFRSMRMPRDEGARLGVVVSLVEDPKVGDGAFFHRQRSQVLQEFRFQNHA